MEQKLTIKQVKKDFIGGIKFFAWSLFVVFWVIGLPFISAGLKPMWAVILVSVWTLGLIIMTYLDNYD